jgi:hypothetical protein
MTALGSRLEEAQELFESGHVLEAASALGQLATEPGGPPQLLASAQAGSSGSAISEPPDTKRDAAVTGE